MKLAHISDLHLGRRLGGYPLMEDQRHILSQIADIAVNEGCDGIVIAGDIYDKSAPSAEAVGLFDEFLTRLSKTSLTVYIISGNHDSPERIGYGREILSGADIHICADQGSGLRIIRTEDGYGELDICLMPFVKPPYVRALYPDEKIESYTDMMRVTIERSGVDLSRRCLIICHQFITGAATCDSEYISVGTLDNIDAEVFEGFDYVAAGHIHGPQSIGKNIRYCGTPLKYSSSESGHSKSVTIVELKEKGNVSVNTLPLTPLREVREICGKYDELMSREFYQSFGREDFCYITLTDDEDIPNVMQKLRTVYPRIVQLSYDNSRTRKISMVTAAAQTDTKTPYELFSALFAEQNGCGLSPEQEEYVRELIDQIWGDEE